MPRWVRLAVLGLVLTRSPVAAQAFHPTRADSLSVQVPAAGFTLPPTVWPRPVAAERAPVTDRQAPGARGLAPVVGGVVGLGVGALVGRWLVQRNCTERCGEKGLYGLLGGGVIGFSAGFTIGRVVAGERPPSSRPPIPTRTP